MVVSIKENVKKVKGMVGGDLHVQMAVNMKGSSKMI